jgi:hypothetical protein
MKNIIFFRQHTLKQQWNSKVKAQSIIRQMQWRFRFFSLLLFSIAKKCAIVVVFKICLCWLRHQTEQLLVCYPVAREYRRIVCNSRRFTRLRRDAQPAPVPENIPRTRCGLAQDRLQGRSHPRSEPTGSVAGGNRASRELVGTVRWIPVQDGQLGGEGSMGDTDVPCCPTGSSGHPLSLEEERGLASKRTFL